MSSGHGGQRLVDDSLDALRPVSKRRRFEPVGRQAAKAQLVDRVGRDVFENLVVDLAKADSSQRAAAELVSRGQPFDAPVLNAGAVLTDLQLTDDGLEGIFAASIFGHHIITAELVAADLLTPGARVVIVGSEAADNDLPKAMSLSVADFALHPTVDDEAFKASIMAFARGQEPTPFDANEQYATTKLISAWWAGEMQRRHYNRFDFFNVSPGANAGTSAARHQTGAMKVMFTAMARFGHLVGMNQPVCDGMSRTWSTNAVKAWPLPPSTSWWPRSRPAARRPRVTTQTWQVMLISASW